MLWLAVAARIVSNPLANVFQKLLTQRGAHPLFVIFASHTLLSCACAPFLFSAWRVAGTGFWFDIWFCALLAVAGNALLVEALKRSDLSVLGPINAYKSVVSLLPGMIFLREFPSAWGFAGIALILAGSYFVTDNALPGNPFARFLKDPGVQFRLAALILSAVEAIFLKRALLASSAAATFVFWSVLGFVISLAWLVVGRVQVVAEFQRVRTNKSNYLSLALMTGGMQLSTLLVMERLHVSSALALFQTSALVSVFFGHAVFKEKQLAKRLLGTVIMIGGATLIILARKV